MKFSLRDLLLVTMIVPLLSGCGGASPSPSGSKIATTTAPPPASEASVAPSVAPVVAKAAPMAPPVVPFETPQQMLVKMFGGESMMEIFQEPKRVQAYRLNGQNYLGDRSQGIDGYEVLSGPVTVAKNQIEKLKEILLDPDIYYWDRAKGCAFSPGVAIVYTSEKGSLDVLLCFGCDQIEIFQNGKRVGGEDFDKARGLIVAVVMRMFPDDAEIQALTPERS